MHSCLSPPPPPPKRASPNRRRDERLVEWKKQQNAKLLEETVERFDPNKDPLVEVSPRCSHDSFGQLSPLPACLPARTKHAAMQQLLCW
jgi:hypothetical protein